jgi:hypothetical protein
VEVLRLSSHKINLRDLAKLKHYTNVKEAHIHWLEGPSVTEARSKLKTCTHLRRLTLTKKTISLTFRNDL